LLDARFEIAETDTPRCRDPARRRFAFLAFARAAYQRRHGLTDELLADVLG